MKLEEAYNWLTQYPIAHRGLWNDEIPENSIAAINQAAENGYAVEIDVRVTKDQRVVVFHDSNMRRMTGQKGSVRSFDYELIRMLRLGSEEHHIPLLYEVFQEVDDRVPIFIEIKSSILCSYKDFEVIYKVLQSYRGRFAIMSFDPRLVRWFHIRGALSMAEKIIPLGQIFHRESGTKQTLSILFWYFFGAPGHFLILPWQILKRPFFVRRRRFGWKILTWTIRDTSQLNNVKEYCDQVIFDTFDGYNQKLKTWVDKKRAKIPIGNKYE